MRALLLAAVLAAACAAPAESSASAATAARAARAGAPGSGPAPAATREPVGGRTLVLVSIDGFRHDYAELHGAPRLARFAAEGVRAEALVPVFPTKTFPNHYTLVTGLRPERHGVVDNAMYDPELDAAFRLTDPAAVGDGRWWGGEPLWVTVERAGRVAAAMFWPGSEAEIGGVRPTHWFPYDARLPGEERVARVLAWLDLPPPQRPALATLYFSVVDSAGHAFGPESPEVGRAVRATDELVGTLLDGIAERGLEDAVDVVVTSDHGMRAVDAERVIVLDELVDLAGVHVVTLSPVVQLRGPAERLGALLERLRGVHPHLSAWAREEVPEHLHYRAHRRIAPVVALADPGWTVVLAADVERGALPRGGSHGWDPTDPQMGAFFAARGPSFRRGLVVPPFESVHVRDLLARALGVAAPPGDGDLEAVRELLREPGER